MEDLSMQLNSRYVIIALLATTVLGACASLLAVVARITIKTAFYRQPAATIEENADASPDETAAMNAARTSGQAWFSDTPHNKWVERTEDGVEIVGYFIPAAAANGKCVLLMHGQRSSAQDISYLAELYWLRRYDVLLVDQRAHGASGGRCNGLGWTERTDCLRWVQRILAERGGRTELIAHGISLGATAIINASQSLPHQVRAVIADSAFTSVTDIITYRLHKRHLPATLILATMRLLADKPIREALLRGSATLQIGLSATPTLFIHARNDKQNPVWMSRQLFDACSAQKELRLTDGGLHGMSYVHDGESYMSQIEDFIAAH